MMSKHSVRYTTVWDGIAVYRVKCDVQQNIFVISRYRDMVWYTVVWYGVMVYRIKCDVQQNLRGQ